MKILHLCAVDFTVRHFISPIMLDQMQQGHEVAVACTPGEDWDFLTEELGLKCHGLQIPRGLNPKAVLRAIVQINRLLKKEQPDVLHLHTPLASMMAKIAACFASVPVKIYHVHGFYFHPQMDRNRYARHVLLEKLFSPFHDAMFCVSEEDTRLAKHHRLAKTNRIYHTPNGVDSEKFKRPDEAESLTIRKQYNIPQDAQVVTYIGRMTREKGILEFLEAFDSVAENNEKAYALIVGPQLSSERDQLQTELKKRIASRSQQIQLLGYTDDVAGILKCTDLFCLPSYREGLPVSIIEAMMSGCAILTTNVRGCRELVKDGVNGFLVPPRNSKQLGSAMEYLLEHPKILKQFGLWSRFRALKYYTNDRMLTSIQTAYEDLLK